jgi:predicted metalloprotease
MRWQDAEKSSNVDDVRGRRFGGGGIPIRLGGMGGMGLGGIVALMLITYLLGGDPFALLTGGVPTQTAAPANGPGDPAPVDDEGSLFVKAVLRSTEVVWGNVFREQLGRTYQEPRLVLFTDAVPSACGTNSSAVGPFYCPPDKRVYIDLSFYNELDRRFGAPGDFAQAYVIAHEVGHHVQNLLGIDAKVRAAQQRASEAQANQLSVRVELQADCFAGVWGHYVQKESAAGKVRLDPGDVEEGLRAAAAIGDDAIQRKTQGQVSPESWTHGSSEQRVQWLRRGLDSGQVSTCDTLGS